jgi:DMSO/TMAO reductase YedYZ molybdopterin-dependent catalytic subunit
MMHKRTAVLALAAMIAAALLLGVGACGNSAPDVDWTLKVDGAVSTPLELSYKDLAKMSQADLTDVLMQKSEGEDVTGDWSGVPLQAILDKAGADADWKSLTATAADGYAIEIPLEETRDGIVALKQDGEWITQVDGEHGPIRFVFPHAPANRWAFMLQQITVNK